MSVSVSNAPSSNCSAVTMASRDGSFGANAYGGSMSVVYVGAYALSFSNTASSSSECGSTTASGVSVSVSNAPSSNCSAVTTSSGFAFGSSGANAYGGSMSVVHVGAYAWSVSQGASDISSVSYCDSVRTTELSLSIFNSTFSDSLASSRKHCYALLSSCEVPLSSSAVKLQNNSIPPEAPTLVWLLQCCPFL